MQSLVAAPVALSRGETAWKTLFLGSGRDYFHRSHSTATAYGAIAQTSRRDIYCILMFCLLYVHSVYLIRAVHTSERRCDAYLWLLCKT